MKVQTLTLGNNYGGTGTCNLGNGGTLQVATITRGVAHGAANFNWNDGTIQNYDADTDLDIPSNLTLKLAATGTHAFDIDLNRTATVAAVLSDATSLGTLTKTGMGTLTLSGANTYTGGTTVSGGSLVIADIGALPAGGSLTIDGTGSVTLSSSLGVSPSTASPLGFDTAGNSLPMSEPSTATGGLATQPVPEPSTLALLGIGAMGLTGYAWRRRRIF
jgi:autotransporter-associated beta strand protein